MDNDLVDFAMQCPVSLKLNNLNEAVRINENDPGVKTSVYFERTSDGKQIMRDAMSRYVPSTILSGVKQGFSSPDSSWFKGESIDFVKRSIKNRESNIY
jgi:asparagine synthase (glutamine-hydrolysing)